MGSYSSKVKRPSYQRNTEDETQQSRITASIERELERRQQQSTTVARILLNNTTGEPIFKEIFEAFGSPLSEDDQNLYRVYLRSNLLEDTRKLCQQLEKLQSISQTNRQASIWYEDDLGFDFGEFKSMLTPQEAYNELMGTLFSSNGQCETDANRQSSSAGASHCFCATPNANSNAQILMQYANQICLLWLSETVRHLCCLQKVRPLWQGSKAFNCYSRNDVLRITATNFYPEPQDLAGINLPFPVVTSMRIDGMDFEIHDIGGMHPSRRRQHAHCFDHADIFMFAASLSHYDQPVVGCASISNITSTNRLAAAVDEFAYFLNRKVPSRRRHQPILMLTERDVFAVKTQHKSLSEQPRFSDFQGSPLDGVQYITEKFKCHVPVKDWDVVQVAEGQNQCSLQFLMDSARNILMMENLRRSGFFVPQDLDLEDFYDSD